MNFNALEKKYFNEGIVEDPRHWGSSAGYEFWFQGIGPDIIAAMSSTGDGLDGYGWTTTTLTEGTASSGDFLSSGDHDPTGLNITIAASLLVSPRVFGGYSHALQAARFLGQIPTKLTLEFYLDWITTGTNQSTAFIGFAGPSVVDATAANSSGCIISDGTNFVLKTQGGGTDTGAAVDSQIHKWKISITTSNIEWWIDDVSQGTVTTPLDIFPVSFVARANNNGMRLITLMVYYEL